MIQGIISYLTSKKKTLDVMMFLSDVKLFISHLFDVEKENMTYNVYFIWRQIVHFSLIWRQKRKHCKKGVPEPICILFSGSEIVLMIHYLSNDDDTGSEFGNNGAALTKNS